MIEVKVMKSCVQLYYIIIICLFFFHITIGIRFFSLYNSVYFGIKRILYFDKDDLRFSILNYLLWNLIRILIFTPMVFSNAGLILAFLL